MSEKIPNASQGENRAGAGGPHRSLGLWLTVLAVALFLVVGGLYVAGVPAVTGGDREPAETVVDEPEAGPVPVLLVPGWRDTREQLEPFRGRFLEAGWPEERVRSVEFRDPVGGNVANARQIAEEVAELRDEVGASHVDVVAHSMGGLAVRHYLSFLDGGEEVRRVVFLGTPHRGTVLAFLGWGEGARDMLPGSEFLEALNEGRAVPDGVQALALRTPLDLRILPSSSAILPGVHNVEVCCPTHPGMIDDENTFEAVERFLRAGPDLPDPFLPDRFFPRLDELVKGWDELVQGIGGRPAG